MRNVFAFARRYMKPYWRPLLLAQVIFLTATGVGLIMPLVVRQAIDVGILSNDQIVLFYAALFVFVIGLVRVVLSYLGKKIRFRIASQVMTDLRRQIFARILWMGPRVKEKFNHGELLARLTTETSVLRTMVNGGILDVANNLCIVIAIISISLILDWRLTLIAAVPHLIVGMLSVTVGYTLQKWVREVRERFASMASAVYESLSAVQIVKAFGRESNQTGRIDGLSHRLAVRNKHVSIRQSLYMSAYGTLAALSMLLMIWFGAQSVIRGDITPGTYVALLGYAMILHMPFHSLIGSMYQWFKSDVAVSRIDDVLKMEPETVDPTEGEKELEKVRGAVELHGIRIREGDRVLLDQLDLTVSPGEFVAIIGRSGSGKSLLLQLIANLIRPDSGEVKLDGFDLRNLSTRFVRNHVVYVSQEPWLFQGTLEENITFGRPEASREEIEEAVDRSGLRSLVSSLPEGLMTVIGTRGLTLSGGERQRVGLARALILKPKVLLLDDPTANLDAVTEDRLMETIESLKREHTVIIATGRWSVARRAERIHVLQDGRIVESGHPWHLMKEPNIRDLLEDFLIAAK